MKAFAWELTAPRTLRRQEFELDHRKLGPDDVLAETEYTVVSTGTELAAWTGKPPLRPSKVYPRLVGYCNLARITGVGSAVSGLSPGDRVITHQSHRSAFVCPSSEILLRVNPSANGLARKLAATYLYHIPYTALLAAEYAPEHRVAIVGMGALGIAAASLLRARDAEPVVFTNQDPRSLTVLGRPLREVCRKDLADPSSRSADICIDTSDEWADYLLCLRLARAGGTIVCVGFPGRGQPPPDFNPLDSQYFYDKQLTIRHCGQVPEEDLRQNMRHLASLIEAGLLDPADIVQTEASSADLAQVYEALAARRGGSHSALITWTS